MLIRPATAADRDAIWAIIGPVIRAGETYALDRDMSEDAALAYWLGPDRETFVAEHSGPAASGPQDGGQGPAGPLVGTYFIRANAAGGGRHVCNCGYVTDPAASGRGIAREMHAHSLDIARARGFRAMQFNFVIASNERAVRLWTSLGFETVGRLPGAFEHPRLGYVDALVMYRGLWYRDS